MFLDDAEDRDLFALIAEESAVRDVAMALDDADDPGAAAAHECANRLMEMIRASRAKTIRGVLALLDVDQPPFTTDAAIEGLRDIDQRLRAAGCAG
jgi:hypothetical protein